MRCLVSLALLGCAAASEPRAIDNVVDPATPEERGPVVLFVGAGPTLIPAICSERPGSLSAGPACLGLIGDAVVVRTERGKLETARRASFECGPTEERTEVFDLPREVAAVFAVSPPGEPTAHLEERTISARQAGEGDEIFSGSLDHDQGITTAATSDIDGDGVREAVVVPQGGEDTGPLLYVVRFAPGRPTEILFRWDCRS